MPGQLAALAGLGALRHLDLDLARVDQVLAGDAEAARRHLLDRRVLRVAELVAPAIALGVLAAFAGVALAADAVHRDRQRLVRFLADRAVRHRAGLEALHQAFDRFHFVERHRLGRLEIEQAAQRGELGRLVVDQRGVGLERLVVAGAHRLLQAVDAFRVEQVVLALGAPLVLAAHGQRVAVAGGTVGERRVVAQQHFLRDHVGADAADARGGPGEVFVDHVLAQAERLEHLRAAIALQRRDAHLRRDLDHALGRRLDEVLARRLVVDAGQQAFADHLVDGLERQVRVDRADAVADQQREVVHLARLARLQHQARARAQALADQVVVQPGHGHQRRDRREVLVDAAVAEDDDVDFFLLDQAPRHQAQLFHRLDQALLAAAHAEQDRQHADAQAGQVHAADAREFLVGDDRPLELEAAAVGRLRVEQVAFRAQARLGRGDDLLADAVDRRVGDLREQLLEVVVQQARLVRQHRQRRVVAHRADRLDAVARHRRQHDALVLEGVAEGHLPLQQRVGVGLRQLRRLRQVVDVDLVLVEPLAVRARRGERALDLLVLDDAALRGVDQEHLARLQPALAHHVFRRHVEHAGFRGQDDEIVLGHVIAARAQAVAVEHRADLRAVGERDRGGAVPRLHQAGVVLVEGALLVVHRLVVGPRLGDHHHHGVRQRAAREIEQLERVVEHARVAAVGVDDRADLADVVAERLGLEARLARVHPVGVAAHRVDLAVVGDVAVRVRAVPAGEGVGAEARMHQRQRGFHQRVVEVREILVELRREQHALEDDRARREADDVPVLGAGQRRGADLAVGALAHHVQLALEREVVGDVGAAGDEHLAHERFARARRLAQHAVVGRHGAPAEHGHALGLHHLLELLLDLAAHRGVARQEDDAAAVLARRRQRNAGLAADVLVERVRHLQQHAGAVTGVDLAAAGAAVVQVLQHLDRLLQHAVRLDALDVDDEPLAAGIVLVARVVEPLAGGRAELRGGRRRCGGVRHQRGSQVWLLCAHRRPCLRFGRRSGAWRAAARAEPDFLILDNGRGYDTHMTCGARLRQCTATMWSKQHAGRTDGVRSQGWKAPGRLLLG